MFELLITFVKKLRDSLRDKLRVYNVTLPYFIIVLLALMFIVFGINFFIEFTETLIDDELVGFDNSVTDFVLSYRSPAFTSYFKFVTDLGDVEGYIAVTVIGAIISKVVLKKWKYILQIGIVMIISALSNLVLKRVFNRARPTIEQLVTAESLSYPSGHAMAAMSFYGFVIYLFYKMKMNRFLKYTGMIIFAFLILSIGVSRIYLGVHYPSDIVAGFIAGAVWVVFCIIVFNLIEVFRRDPNTEAIDDHDDIYDEE
ncbi:phosphatase PAP2 family protein [Hanstruepera ponticola]|uniref:phosphatase PAP2 family protein n=1 Tax=Hanstruepera ponticola TaxID=2042995 RepID=UPI00178404C2|nr:phosphatase PAP2 family protein [Hanstruepera ponticola]